VLFHLTISHSAQDCPGRRPSEPPALIAPSDTRRALEQELGVSLHFVLWGASCILWAQPEHLAFAVLEADDLEAVSQYVDTLMPSGWTCTALPVWNLPAQLRLVRQVRMAPPMEFGQALPSAKASPGSEAPAKEAPQPADPSSTQQHRSMPPRIADEPSRAREAEETKKQAASAGKPIEDLAAQEAEAILDDDDSPGTITRLLRELESAPTPPGEWKVITRADQDAPDANPTPTQILSQLAQEPPPTARVWLVSIAGPAKGKTYVVGALGATIGRVPNIPVCIPDERLSREHARIEFRDGSYWLSDLGSTNGTALNGTLLTQPQQLQSGDSIELGSTMLVATIEPSPTG
jgi:hypothetical protein